MYVKDLELPVPSSRTLNSKVSPKKSEREIGTRPISLKERRNKESISPEKTIERTIWKN